MDGEPTTSKTNYGASVTNTKKTAKEIAEESDRHVNAAYTRIKLAFDRATKP